MFASASAFDVLVALLVCGFISALFGWAGGVGARLTFSWRLDRIEAIAASILNRSKGQAGQAKTAETRQATKSAMAEAEALAAQLRSTPFRRPPQNEAELTQLALKRGLVMSGKGEGETG
jgi:hypothetical protein